MKKHKLVAVPDNDQMPDNRKERDLYSLLDVGRALSSEHETDKILDMIVQKAIENTMADGGSIYLVERIKQDSLGGARTPFKRMLRFHKSSNKKLKSTLVNKLMGIDAHSIAGYVALTGHAVLIDDCYSLSSDTPFHFNREFDKETGYRTKSILAVPIKTNKGQVIGVVQLVNKLKAYRRKTDVERFFPDSPAPESEIVTFNEYDGQLMQAFASHAAVALENAKLTSDIAKLFESFVKASVTAIEARDPSTSGHSDRVAVLTTSFAQSVDTVQVGEFSDIRFSTEQMREIRYAALLHDFGKIGVRENILLKAKKLFPHELETILLRLDSLKAKNEAKKWREVAEQITQFHEQGSLQNPQAELGKMLWQIDSFNKQVDDIRQGILKANESQVLDRDFDIAKLLSWIDGAGQALSQTIITTEEKKRLSIARGTLGEDERREIESHVTHTYLFLSQIAWTDDLSGVPDIAYAHHEKLDGTGYPRSLKEDLIPIQSRMMTISDIYDALTAMDRPYKKALTPEKAIDILNLEANQGKLDRRLLKIFVEAEVYKSCNPNDFGQKKKVG